MVTATTPLDQDHIVVATWNVNEGKNMPKNQFQKEDIDAIFGVGGNNKPLMVVFGIQETCQGSAETIADNIRDMLNANFPDEQDVYITLPTAHSGSFCNVYHGSTGLVAFGLKGLVEPRLSQAAAVACESGIKANPEKAVSGLQVVYNGKVLCFATSHLAPNSSKRRRNCMKKALVDTFPHADSLSWKSCDIHIISGDWNMRTAKDSTGKLNSIFSAAQGEPNFLSSTAVGDDAFKALLARDELSGPNAFVTDGLTPGTMSEPPFQGFQEGPIDFWPSYSTIPGNEKEGKNCDGKKAVCLSVNGLEANCPAAKRVAASGQETNGQLCYRYDRPASWADRILYKGASLVPGSYKSLPHVKSSDHFPVKAVFTHGIAELPRVPPPLNQPVLLAIKEGPEEESSDANKNEGTNDAEASGNEGDQPPNGDSNEDDKQNGKRGREEIEDAPDSGNAKKRQKKAIKDDEDMQDVGEEAEGSVEDDDDEDPVNDVVASPDVARIAQTWCSARPAKTSMDVLKTTQARLGFRLISLGQAGKDRRRTVDYKADADPPEFIFKDGDKMKVKLKAEKIAAVRLSDESKLDAAFVVAISTDPETTQDYFAKDFMSLAHDSSSTEENYDYVADVRDFVRFFACRAPDTVRDAFVASTPWVLHL